MYDACVGEKDLKHSEETKYTCGGLIIGQIPVQCFSTFLSPSPPFTNSQYSCDSSSFFSQIPSHPIK